MSFDMRNENKKPATDAAIAGQWEVLARPLYLISFPAGRRSWTVVQQARPKKMSARNEANHLRADWDISR
jgi:hypothetical protein